MLSFIIGKIASLTGFNIPPKAFIALFLVLAVAGALFWFRHKIIASEEMKCLQGIQKEENEALKKQLLESQQYASFLLNAQKKNDNFIQRQRKALNDAKENDGAVADVLRNSLERLRRDRENNP